MGDKKRLEEQIRKVGGRYAEEIIGLVRTLAEVDVRILTPTVRSLDPLILRIFSIFFYPILKRKIY